MEKFKKKIPTKHKRNPKKQKTKPGKTVELSERTKPSIY